jgi:Pyruvate/2-oxoacid:ferredoxin oxidoreductase delta subunit
MTRVSAQVLNQRLLDAALDTKHLVITCERTGAVLRTAATGDDADDGAKAALLQLDASALGGFLLTIPCLGTPCTEVWFSVLNEIASAPLEDVGILLPPGQCSLCPANRNGTTEELFSDAVSVAERWADVPVTLFSSTSELPIPQAGPLASLRNRARQQTGRREALGGLLSELRDLALDPGVEKDRALKLAQLKRRRQDAYRNTRLAERLSPRASSQATAQAQDAGPHDPAVDSAHRLASQSGVAAKARITPRRYILLEALGRDARRAGAVVLQVSGTDEARCCSCGTCVDVCPVKARSLAPSPDAKASCDDLYCVGCGACVASCKQMACSLRSASGSLFLTNI